MIENHCLGLEWLGICAYDPAKPGFSYFDIGSGIAALGFLLAIQQLIKPIYRFRLRCFGIRFQYLSAAVVVGFLMSVFAAALPNFPVPRDQWWAFPIAWEIFAGLIIAATYGLASFCMLVPARLMSINHRIFLSASAQLLSEAKDDDLVAFAQDISANITKVFQFAKAWQEADQHASDLKFEKLREEGKPLSFTGRPPISAFYLFARREELKRGSAAITLLRLLADEKLCYVMVRDCPWIAAKILNEISSNQLHFHGTENFVQEIARQAITKGDSVLAREIEYDGLGSAPILLNSLFNDRFILREYRPFQRLSHPIAISKEFIKKIGHASELAFKLALSDRDFWHASHFYDIKSVYEGISRELGWVHRGKNDRTYPQIDWSHGIKTIYHETNRTLNSLDPQRREHLFQKRDQDRFQTDLISIVAAIVYDSLEGISNNFSGYDDEYWSHAIAIYMELFGENRNRNGGLNPLQQKVTIMLLDKLRENMQGWYPSISRVLIATIGPFAKRHTEHENSPENIVKHLVYAELRNLSKLHESSPEKISDFLPDNVKYDATENSLAHRYSGGEVEITYLDKIDIIEFDIFDSSLWDISPIEEQ